ncbi:hypothetical protein ACWEDF_32180 [Micromonospora chersina]
MHQIGSRHHHDFPPEKLDPDALARRDLLRERGVRQAATWPTEDETVAQVLSVYDELTQPRPMI